MQTLIELLEAWGLGLVALNVLADQSGLPLPSYPTLVVASALAPRDVYGVWLIAVVAVLAALAADAGWYFAGARMGRAVLRGLCRATQMPDSCVRRTESTFLRFGLPALLVVKFVPGFSALSAALAGSTRMSPVRYFAVDFVGAAVWAGTAVLIGDVFRETVNDALVAVTGYGRYGVFAVIVVLGMYALWRAYRRQRFLRELRMARVTVDELHAMRAQDGDLLIVDARPAAVQHREGRIPGAIPFEASALDSGSSSFAADREVVVYCDCPNEASAALVAKRLFARGARKVRPLKGGISAWAAAGYGIER